eukprot:scaffold2175_cov381-Prasinococcus_capsulatus_cf.AAC.9
MEASAEEGDFFSVKQQLKSILGPPNSLKDNLIGAAAALPSMKETDNAITVAFDLMEYVEQIDYNKYFESRLSTLGTPSGEQNAEFSTFVGKCIKVGNEHALPTRLNAVLLRYGLYSTCVTWAVICRLPRTS